VLWWIEWSLILYALLSIWTYLVPILLARYYFTDQDLKKKYNASWALVTGGSSGIGKSLVQKLAKQKLNVVIVALDDELLRNFYKEIAETYPSLQFRAVGVNLGKRDADYDYMKVIQEKTDDIKIQIVMNCAGYLILKGFVKTDMQAQLTNIECNTISTLRITHHFMCKMVENKLKGAITFVSSTAAYFPSPGNTAYASGKAFLSNMATCLAIEGKPYGIDITCLMSGPMMTRFYEGQPKLDVLNFMMNISDTPDTVADVLIKSIGRLSWRDSSLWAVSNRLIIKVIDVNLLVELFAWGQKYLPDYKKNPQLS